MPEKIKKDRIRRSQILFFLAVFLEAVNSDVNSSASLINGAVKGEG